MDHTCSGGNRSRAHALSHPPIYPPFPPTRRSFAKIEGSDTEYFVVEEYTSVKALDIHSNSAHFKRLVPAMGKLSSTISVEKAFPLVPEKASGGCSLVKMAGAFTLGALGAFAATKALKL